MSLNVVAIKPRKRITGRRYFQPKYAANNSSSVELTLECGHKQRRPRSQEPVKFARCGECGDHMRGVSNV